ncbi:MAG: hypothetical protein ABI665_23720 [Vicinamibacterales bacterium]
MKQSLLSAAAASFTEAGQDAAVREGHRLDAVAGSFIESGIAAALTAGHIVSAVAGSYLETGQAATLIEAHRLSAAAGSVTLAGMAIAFNGGRFMNVAAGAFVEAGQSAALLKTSRVDAAAAAFAETGVAASMTEGHRLAAGAGALAEAGFDASLVYVPSSGAFTLSAAPAAFLADGQPAALSYAPILIPHVGSAGGPSRVLAPARRAYRLPAQSGRFRCAGLPMTFARAYRLALGWLSVGVTLTDSALQRAASLSAEPASFASAAPPIAPVVHRRLSAVGDTFVSGHGRAQFVRDDRDAGTDIVSAQLPDAIDTAWLELQHQEAEDEEGLLLLLGVFE